MSMMLLGHVILILLIGLLIPKREYLLTNILRLVWYGVYLFRFSSLVPHDISEFLVFNSIDIYWFQFLSLSVLLGTMWVIKTKSYFNYKLDFIFGVSLIFLIAKGVMLLSISFLVLNLFIFIWIFAEKYNSPHDFKIFFSLVTALVIIFFISALGNSTLIYFSHLNIILVLLEAFTIFLLLAYFIFNLNYIWKYICDVKHTAEAIIIFFILYIMVIFYKLMIIVAYVLDSIKEFNTTLYMMMLVLFCVFNIFMMILALGREKNLFAPFSLFNIMIFVPMILLISFLDSAFGHYIFLYFFYVAIVTIVRLLLDKTQYNYLLFGVDFALLITPLIALGVLFTPYWSELNQIPFIVKWAPFLILSMTLIFSLISLHSFLKVGLKHRINDIV